MAAQAGWYPDPEGDTSRLRWWDGTKWTDDFTAAPQADANTQADQAAQNTQQAEYVQADYVQAESTVPPVMDNTDYQRFDAEQIYPMTNQDRTLRLIAFIFCIVSSIGSCWLILPLAWMIPMTVVCWNIYKGKRANTIAFDVCTLIFVSLVAGVLLLCSRKDEA